MLVSERTVEQYLKRRVEDVGGLCLKWTGERGVPDRICVFKEGLVVFVEVKTTTGTLSASQMMQLNRLRKRQANVAVVWSKHDVDLLVANYTPLTPDDED